jgi:alkylhydroperoxidase family enzyme
VAAFLDAAQLAELTLVVAFYNMVARVLEPLQVDLDARYSQKNG